MSSMEAVRVRLNLFCSWMSSMHVIEIPSGVAIKDENGEGRLVGVPKFCSWGKCTMTVTNIYIFRLGF